MTDGGSPLRGLHDRFYDVVEFDARELNRYCDRLRERIAVLEAESMQLKSELALGDQLLQLHHHVRSRPHRFRSGWPSDAGCNLCDKPESDEIHPPKQEPAP